MEKLRFPITLSPDAVEALRTLIHGTTANRSPTVREVHAAVVEAGCTPEDRTTVLVVLGLGTDEDAVHARRHPTGLPTPHRE